MKFLIVLSLFLFCKISVQSPPDFCKEDKPFRSNDRYCHNFSEICFNTKDEQCNQLLNACKQCPPSNITIALLRNIWEMSKLQSNFTKEEKIFQMIDKLSTTQQIMENKLNDKNITIIILLVILLIILILLISENRFKIVTKCIQNSKTKRNRSESTGNRSESTEPRYHPLTQSRKENLLKDFSIKTANELADIKRNIEILSVKLSADLQKTIKFYKEGVESKYIELYVHNDHSIVHVKQRLCAELKEAMTNEYKKMKLKYDGRILNDNDYLLKNIDFATNSLNYITDETINTSEILVVELKGKMRLLKNIQLHKNESIANLLTIISGLIGTKNFHVYKKCIENHEMIELSISNTDGNNNQTLKDYHLMDGDFLHVVAIENGELVLRSIFNEINSFTVSYKNIDRISSFLKDKNSKDFILFYCNKIIDENKFIFEFDISNDSQVKFCEFKKFENITNSKSIFTGKNRQWEIYFANHKKSGHILIKKYDINVENLRKQEWVLNELKTFLITKSQRRFIQLNDVYKDDKSFYISMENMSGGTLKYYLKNNNEFNSEQILQWAAQILEGLQLLHKKKIVHRDLNSSSILVDDNKNLKLSNFNLSKYNENGVKCSIYLKKEQLCYIKLRYMAPEILDSREYGYECDVWSLGAVLVRIVTGKKPYPHSNKVHAQKKIIDSGKIEYDLPDKFDPKIKTFIDSCFGKDPTSRCKIEDLVENEMIKNILK